MNKSLSEARFIRTICRAIHLLVIAVLTVFATRSVVAQSYTTGAIEADGVTEIIPYAVNNNQVVVGSAKFGDHYGAFRWEDGILTELQTPPDATGAIARDINDDGLIVGGVSYTSECATGRSQGAFWTATDTNSTITLMDYSLDQAGLPSESECEQGSIAYGTNSNGSIVGSAGLTKPNGLGSDSQNSSPALSSGGGWTELADLTIPPTHELRAGGWAWDVNDSGLAVGKGAFGPDRAFVSSGGSIQVLEIDPGFHGLNNLDHVVGKSPFVNASTDQVARLWDGKDYIDLDSSNSEALAVNDSDIAVGRRVGRGSFGLPFRFGIGMLYRPGAPPASLTNLAASGFVIKSPNDINDEGMIVGVGELAGEETAFWMAPSSSTFLLEGTVRDGGGTALAGIEVLLVRVIGGGQTEVLDPLTTDASGRYSANLSAGEYFLWIEPRDDFAPHPDAPCTARDYFCRVQLDQARSVDFIGTITTATTFAEWIGMFPEIAASGLTGLDEDFDGDGFDNGIEFYLGLDPTRDSRSSTTDTNADNRPVLIREAGGIALEFTPAAGRDGAILVTGQTSSDGLSNWADIPITDSAVANRKKISLPFDPGTEGFVRLVVRLPEG